MEQNTDTESLAPSKESSTTGVQGAISLGLTSNENDINADKEENPTDNEQTKADQPEADTQETQIKSLESPTHSDMKFQQSFGMPESSIKRRKTDFPEYFGTCDIPVYHKVEFTVLLSYAFYYKQMTTSLHNIHKKTKPEVPVALGYYHTEFQLLPIDDEPIQIDIVPYNNFARVFIDKTETKTVNYHHDGHYFWVIWNQIFEVEVTNDLLLQLFDYVFEVNVWDTKEKLMTRTRFDKPRFMKVDYDEADCKKQVNFQKEWLRERSSQGSPCDNQKLPKVKDDSPSNALYNESENPAEAIKSNFSRMSLANTDLPPNQLTRKKSYIVKKNPPARVLVKLRSFFSDMRSLTKRLTKQKNRLMDMMVSVNLNKSLLSGQQKRHLNPMVITIHSLEDMPGSSDEETFDYSRLKEKCYPVYLRYQFLHGKPYESLGKPQSKDIIFNDINVILTGNIDAMELRELFLGQGLVIEIHDRDRKPKKTDYCPLLFGDDLNDEKLSNVGVITSKKTKINPYKPPPANSLDPFGIARIDLSSFTLGQNFSYQEASIYNSPTFDSLKTAKKNGHDLSKGNGPFKPGQYVSCCSTINVTIKLAYPIIMPPVANPRPLIVPTYNCPFGRMIFRIKTEKQEFLQDILMTITRINGNALDLNDVPDNILIATLCTLITTKRQRHDRLLDIITGFHIIDEKIHLLVLEGLQNQGIKLLIDEYGEADDPDVTILFDTNLVCSERLYASFDVILRKVKLYAPLDSIIKQPLIYIRDMVPRLCYDALLQIHELSKCSRLIDAIRSNLFPTANMVRSLSKEFGVVIKEDQLNINVACQEETKHKPQVSHAETFTEEMVDHETIKWTHIDHYNKPYVQLLKQNLNTVPDDFINKNIKLVNEASEKLKKEKKEEKTVDFPQAQKEIYNYAMNTYNTIELKKLKLRRQLDPKSMYTYCPEFHHSMTYVPTELKHLYKEEEIHKKKKWRTPNGWVCPGYKTIVDTYIHPKKPSEGRIDDLTDPYEKVMSLEERCPRNRCAFTWSERTHDMDIWRQPKIDPREQISIFQTAGGPDPLMLKKEAEIWERKTVVTNMRTHCHRQLSETEMQMRGRQAACQLDQLKGLLKDRPVRRVFKYHPVADMPALNVVNYPELSATSADRNFLRSYDSNRQRSAYIPGPYWPERSLSLFGNQMLAHDYEHEKFALLKGDDFKLNSGPEPKRHS